MIDKKLTEKPEIAEISEDALIHVVEPNDTTQGPTGSSYKFKAKNLPDARQDNIDIKITFKISENATNEDVLAEINAYGPFEVNEVQSVWFVAMQPAIFVVGQPYIPARILKYKMLNKGKGTYGYGATPLTINDIELVYESYATTPDVETNPSTDIVPFGDIAEEDISEWLNVQNPAIAIQPQNEGYTLFQGTVDGVAKSYLWIGAEGVYGLGDTQSTMADFQLLDDSLPPPASNLQEVTTNGNTTNNDVVFTDERGVIFQGGSAEFNAYMKFNDGLNIVSTNEEFKFNGKDVVRSIGGVEADYNGDVTLPEGTQDLQSVTDNGSTTTNEITVPSIKLIDIDAGTTRQMTVYDNQWGFESVNASAGTTGIGRLDFAQLDDIKTYTFPNNSGRIPLSVNGHIPDLSTGDVTLPSDPTKADLDINGKVPLSQINDALLGNNKFMGIYDGSTITSSPDATLVGTALPTAATGNTGWYFISMGAYTNGGNSYNTGDWIVSVGTSWQKVDNTDAVSSVAGLVGVISASGLKAALALVIGDISGLQTAIDAKVQNSLSASTTIAPSATAVNGGLALAPKLLKLTTTDSSTLTGSTTETIMASALIPANSISTGSLIVRMPFKKTGTANTAVLKVYVNTTNNLSGTPVQIGTYTTAASNSYIPFKRDFELKPSNVIFGFPPAASNIDGTATANSAPLSDTFNVAVDNYIIVTAALTNSADSVVLSSFKVVHEKAV